VRKLLNKFWGWVKPYLTPRMVPIILSVWAITNGLWYVLAFAPIKFIPDWLSVIAKGYLIFLWSPIALEKPIILAVSIFIYRFVYREKFVKIS
jgi:hypothetical protein